MEHMNNSHKTAISRTKLSAPVQWLLDNGEIPSNSITLDYGCGKGTDVDFLNGKGIQTWRYDPHFFPDYVSAGIHDVVLCTYVLNTLNYQTDHLDVVRGCVRASNGGPIFFTVRNDKANLNGWTKRETYQIFVPMDKLQKDLNHVSWHDRYPNRKVTEVHKTSSYVIYKAEVI